MTLRPCLHHPCSQLVTPPAGYCATHALLHPVAQWPKHRRPFDERQTYAWRKRRAAAIAEHPWCASCGATDRPLQLDHRHALSRGGSAEDGTQVLCAECNRRKGNL